MSNQRMSQEEIDLLYSHLKRTVITDTAVASAMRKLSDSVDGPGNLPCDWLPYCHKCDEQITDGEMMGEAFGNFYHSGCVPSVQNGPMPVGQYLAGVKNAVK